MKQPTVTRSCWAFFFFHNGLEWIIQRWFVQVLLQNTQNFNDNVIVAFSATDWMASGQLPAFTLKVDLSSDPGCCRIQLLQCRQLLMQPDTINLSFHIYSGILTARSRRVFIMYDSHCRYMFIQQLLLCLSGLNYIFNLILFLNLFCDWQ